MTTLPELLSEASRLSAELEKTIPQLTECVRVSAETENKYRKAKSAAYVTARTMDELKFANERTAWVDAETADLRQARDIADGLKTAQIELIRNLRQQMSLLQTLANANKEDQSFHSQGQYNPPPPEAFDEPIPF